MELIVDWNDILVNFIAISFLPLQLFFQSEEMTKRK